MINNNLRIVIISLFIISILICPIYAETFEEIKDFYKYEMPISIEGKEKEVFVYSSKETIYFKAKDLKNIVLTDEEYISEEVLKEHNVTIIQEYGVYKILWNYRNIRDYDWYIDQSKTGRYSDSNCGPSVSVMTMLWLEENFPYTVQQARKNTRPNGSWWYLSDIGDYFDKYGVDYYYYRYTNVEDLKEIIDDGNIAVVCLNVKYLNQIGTGHFIVIHDYKETNMGSYFISHDPSSHGEIINGKPIGDNRYYEMESIDKAIKNWADYIIVVEKDSCESEFDEEGNEIVIEEIRLKNRAIKQ